MHAPLAIIAFLLSLAVARGDLAEQIAQAAADSDPHAQIELLRRWTDAHPGDQKALQNLVTLWLAVSDFERASDSLRAVSDAGFSARSEAEILWRRDKNVDGSVEVLRQRVTAAPEDRSSAILLADYLRQAGLPAEQVEVLEPLIAKHADPDLLLDRAQAWLALEDPRQALADFRRAASLDPDGRRVQAERPAFERLEQALADIAILEKLPPSTGRDLRLGFCRLSGGMNARARKSADAGLAIWPASASAKILSARARVAERALDAAKARSDLRVDVMAPAESPEALDGLLATDAALAEKPSDIQARTDRAGWLCLAGQNLLASDDIDAVLTASPSNIPALHLAVAISLRLGNFAAAAAHANRLESLKAPKAVLCDVMTGLGQLAFERSQFPLALDFANRSLAAGSTPEAWKLKAACHTRLGQPNEAADAAKKAGAK